MALTCGDESRHAALFRDRVKVARTRYTSHRWFRAERAAERETAFARTRAGVARVAMESMTPGLGMNGHFQVLAADDRFSGMRIGLNRNPAELISYEIVVEIEDQSLDVAAELAEFASERGLESRFDGIGQVTMFEALPV